MIEQNSPVKTVLDIISDFKESLELLDGGLEMWPHTLSNLIKGKK